MDPGPVPLELQGLTQVEEMLISPVMPIMNVYRLPHDQLSYSGNATTGFCLSRVQPGCQ